MKCPKCGKELQVKSEKYSENVNGKPLYKNFAYCDECNVRYSVSPDGEISDSDIPTYVKMLLYDKFYLSPWFIAICFAFSWLYVPFFAGVTLLIIQAVNSSNLKKKYNYGNELSLDICYREAQVNQKNETLKQKQQEIYTLNKKIREVQKQLSDLEADLLAKDTLQVADSMDYSSFDSLSSEECKNKLAMIQQEEKDLVKNDQAVIVSQEMSVRQKNNNIKQLLRCFNAECDNIILAVTTRNIDTLRNKIVKCFDSLNKIFSQNGVTLSNDFLEYKLEEITLMYNYETKRAQEKEIQRAIKEQMLEEERVRHELEKRKNEIEKDQKQFSNEVSKLMKYLQKTNNDVEKQLYADKIRELEEKIKTLEAEKADVINREQNAKAGFVYVISNIGSFGEDVYKIGMTRRLEPMDRIKELSSASVPFEFDVHAMIFSEDAPALETSLHKHFDGYRINKVNPRKEFFKLNIDDIEEYVTKNYDEKVEFTKFAVAKEYRDTIAMAE